MKLVLKQTAKDFLTEKGYNPDFGARPLRRAIGQYVEDPLAEQLLAGDFQDGDTITLTRKEGQDHLTFTTGREKPSESAPPTPQATS